MNRHVAAAVVAVGLLAVAVSTPFAATIHGTLVNGTSGERIGGTVIAVNPGGGMMEETEVKAVDGAFTIEGLDAGAGLYLLRSDYAGVMYTEMVRFEGEETVHATLTVYEQAPSFEGVHVMIPHLAVAAVDGQLQFEVLYELHNHLEPAGTVAGIDDQFRVHLPEDRIEVMRSFVSYDDIPLDRPPVPTDESGIYRIDYPIRPGDTQVGISYAVPYTDSTYTLSWTLLHPIEEITIYAINHGMEVTSNTLELGAAESAHGMTAYSLSDLEAGTKFELTFRGGGAIRMDAAQEDPHAGATTAGTSVVTLPNDMENASTLLMVGMLLLMLVVVGVTTRGAADPLAQRERLEGFYETLLKRLARLDDLNDAGAVAHDVYKAKRAELKNQIASVLYQLQGGATGSHDRGGRDDKATARVAGRTAP